MGLALRTHAARRRRPSRHRAQKLCRLVGFKGGRASYGSLTHLLVSLSIQRPLGFALGLKLCPVRRNSGGCSRSGKPPGWMVAAIEREKVEGTNFLVFTGTGPDHGSLWVQTTNIGWT